MVREKVIFIYQTIDDNRATFLEVTASTKEFVPKVASLEYMAKLIRRRPNYEVDIIIEPLTLEAGEGRTLAPLRPEHATYFSDVLAKCGRREMRK